MTLGAITFSHLLFVLLIVVSDGWIHPPACTTRTALSRTRNSLVHPLVLAYKKRNLMDYNVDYYKVLNVTRGASNEDIARSYQVLERVWNPTLIYQQTPELQFQPESLRVKELKEYLEEYFVDSSSCLEKQDLVKLAKQTYQRTRKVNANLQEKRKPNQDRYDLLKEAYAVLSDAEERRRYNLSGDWGVGGPPMGEGARFVTGKIVDLVDQGFDMLDNFQKKKKD